MINVMKQLSDAGIFVFLEAGKLKTRCAPDKLAPHLVALIKGNKQELIDYLGRQEAAAPSRLAIAARQSHTAPLSFGQQRLWLLDQIDGGSAHYNMPNALRLRGQLDAGALARAFSTILERHESLRTCFKAGPDGEPVQTVQPACALQVPMTDLSALAPAAREARLAALVAAHAGAAFDLGADLLLRAAIVKCAADEHIVLVNMHHIAADGWSIGILVSEFAALYGAFAQGVANPLPPLAIQYSDYAWWQRLWLKGDMLERQLGYWSTQLQGVPMVHSLPLDRPRPAAQTFTGQLVHSTIARATAAALQSLCLEAGATVFMGLHAAFSTLLARYSNESDIVIGTPIANREQAEVAGLIGFFVNTLVLRSDLSENPSFGALLEQSRRVLLDAYTHQQVPFELIVERLQPQRSGSHGPLFQVMLVLQNNEAGSIELPGLSLSTVPHEGAVAKCDLMLNATESGEGLLLDWVYNTDLFDASTIERMAGHFGRLLTALVAAPAASVLSVDFLSNEERDLQLGQWSGAALEMGGEPCLHELFEASVARTPDALALVFEAQQLTFAQLNARANQLAHHLRAGGKAQPDSLIGICCERSVETVVAVLAVLKAGAAYVPLDPAYPAARLDYMISDAALGTVLTSVQLRDRLALGGRALCLDEPQLLAQLAALPAANLPLAGLQAQHLAYVIYTSGSTGVPKGVLQTHRTIVNLVRATAHADGIDRPLRTLQFASSSFDVSVQELATAWHTGSTLLMISGEAKRELAQLPHIFAQLQVERAFLPPAVLNWLAEALEGANASLPFLREVFAAGEALVLSAPLQRFLQRHPACRLWNHYGPTETHVATRQMAAAGDSAVSIGRPVANLQVFVLNRALQRVPSNVAGELYVGGAGLARGYLNRPELTAEKFVPNPFDGGRTILYRTGDLVRTRADGTLDYLGRMDHQVKIRGFRIELGEIDQALKAHAEVQDALTVALPSAGGDQLVAYVAAQGVEPVQRAALAARLRQHLAQALPDYMVPASFQILESMPLTANGKIDRAAMPAPDLSAMQAEYIAPRSAAQRTIADIWCSVLGLERVGLADNFFDLGGHSLSATRLAARINQVFGVSLPIKTVFAMQTLELLTTAVLALDKAQALPALTRAGRSGPLLPSFAQQRLWLLDQIDGGSSHYNMPAALQLTGVLDCQALERAFGAIVERHESLRTRFYAGAGGQPLQQVMPAQPFHVALTDLSDLMPGERQARAALRADEEAGRAFDLASGPMLRAALLKCGAEEHILLVTMHHIASDGWSMALLVREFCTLYGAFAQGKPDPLPPLALQYADYAQWQRGWLQGDVLEQQLGYWSSQLAGLPTVHALPLDGARPAVQGFCGDSHVSRIDSATTGALRALCREAGATLFMGLHAAVSVLLARYSNENDIVVGTPIANREQDELAELIGFFVNMLVLRSDLSANPSFVELIEQSMGTLLNAYAHQQVPFEQIVERLQPQRTSSHAPLFQILLVMQNNETGAPALPGLTMQPIQAEGVGVAKYELTLSFAESGDGLTAVWEYNTDLFARATIARMAGHFSVLLDALVAAPQSGVFDAPMNDAIQQRRLLVEWNDTAAAFPERACIHTLFEQHAAATPDAPALVYAGQSLSYAELNSLANRLARYLVAERAVTADTLVGLCVGRSPAMVIGLLAILKAGGAYLPLDPAYPAARLAYMREDAQLATVLTERALLAALPPGAGQSICIDDPLFTAHLSAYADTDGAAPAVPQASDLAYVLYTSGSTGSPKGVMVEHANVVSLVVNNDYVPLSASTVMLQNAPVSFDAATFEIWGALLNGGLLVLQPRALIEMDALGRFIDEHGINTAWMTAGLFEQFAMAWNAPLPRLRWLLVGGDVVSKRAIGQIRRSNPDLQTINGYGPTENTTFSCCYLMPRELSDAASIPIGRPLCNRTAYVLDGAGRLVPQGVAGELYVGGAGLARAYLNRPELTAERFVPHPFVDGARLYRTGDLVRWLPQGNLEFLGRIDQQVKIRGFRIELGEIEHAVSAHPLVRDAVVVARALPSGDKALVAYVAADAQAGNLAASLRQHLELALPAYMVPSSFVVLEALPLTANGKIDRKALPAPEALTAGQACKAPRSALEQQLCAIWQELLGVPQVGIDDNFFHLGGHSLMAVQLVSRIGQATGIEVALRTLFAAPTVEALAQSMAQGGVSNLVPVRTGGAGEVQAAPLFLVHPGEGEIGYAHALAPCIAPGVPVYALAASGFLEGEEAPGSVAGMAAQYLRAVRRLQPEGPYRIAGWSAGGTIAHEMAAQLADAGAEVSFLGLIDTCSDYKDLPGAGDDAAYLMDELAQAMPAGVQQACHALADGGDVAQLIALCQRAGLLPDDVDGALLQRHLAVRAGIWRALQAHTPRALAVPLSLFMAAREVRADRSLGWSALAQAGLELAEFDGTHHSIMDMPVLAELGRALSDALALAVQQQD